MSVWALLLTSGAFTVLLGLVVDGGHLIDARLDAARTAGQAARMGADELSASSVRSGGDAVNAQAAASRAREYLDSSGHLGSVRVDGDTVSVTIRDRSPARILAVIGIDGFPVEETATARGITEEEAR